MTGVLVVLATVGAVARLSISGGGLAFGVEYVLQFV
jgi:hypothetical protein